MSRERVLASFFNTFERLLALPFEKVLNIYRKFDILVGNQVPDRLHYYNSDGRNNNNIAMMSD